MNEDRIDSVAGAISSLDYEGIIEFDKEDPGYKMFSQVNKHLGDERYYSLLGICAGTVDYQLGGDAQLFWNKLEEEVISHGQLDSAKDVVDILEAFMDEDVNARLNKQKKERLIRVFENDFHEWFIQNYEEAEPLAVWEKLANALNNQMDKKTVVISMKVYDLIHLIENGTYVDFPKDIPIPCDLQIKRVARTSGITDSESKGGVMDAWAEVASQVSDELERSISLLRIDSIVWQSGQIIGDHEPHQGAAKTALVEHFEEVGIARDEAANLAGELTVDM